MKLGEKLTCRRGKNALTSHVFKLNKEKMALSIHLCGPAYQGSKVSRVKRETHISVTSGGVAPCRGADVGLSYTSITAPCHPPSPLYPP